MQSYDKNIVLLSFKLSNNMEYYHLSVLVHEKAKKLGDLDALLVRNKETKTWSPISWKDFSKKIMSTAQALCHFGVKEKSHIGIYTQNMAECFYVDFASFANRAVVVPMYATASIPQITYIIEEAEISLLFVGEQTQYDNAYQVMKTGGVLKQLVIFDKSVQKAEDDKTSIYFESFISPKNRSSQDIYSVEKRMKEAREEDLAHLIYTSGTTGESKGVMLTHANYLEAMKIHDIRLGYLPEHFSSMCFLPLTHIFEKAWSIYCLHKGCTLAINLDPREIQQTIKEVKPQAMCSVPRFWEKVYAGVQEKIEQANPFVRMIMLDAIKTGRRYNLDFRNKDKRAPWWIHQKFNFYDKTIYKTLKKVIGIQNGIIFPCAGAALSDNINIFIQSANIPLIYGYGLSETTATVSCFPRINFEMGTVGKVMPEIEVRIGENNEIQIKGKTVMSGYYKKPEETAKVFTEDGWFCSGDAGILTENHGIILTDRLKDLYKTSNGKYIAPQQLETRLAEDKYIEMAAVIGNQRKYVTALIVPAFDELKVYAEKNQIVYESTVELCQHPQIHSLFESRIAGMQSEFANYEQIKRFTLLPYPFSIETGELTNTLKMKRPFIAEKYKDAIERMYEE